MKKILLLGLVFSFFLLSCNNLSDSSTQQEIPLENDTPKTQQVQETYVEITNNSGFPVDLYSSPSRITDSLVCENIAPSSKQKIKITEDIDRVYYYVSFHIQIAGIDVPYKDDNCTVSVSIRKGEIAKGIVANPVTISIDDSWLILENKTSFGLSFFYGTTDMMPENGKDTMLNIEESGVYKIDASNFSSDKFSPYKIKKEPSRDDIPFPESFEIKKGKIYKLVIDDSSKCYLEEEYSVTCTIRYEINDDIKPDEFTMIVGETLTEKQLPELESDDEGYVFGGWYSEDKQVTKGYVIKSDITLTAKWAPKVYKVEYELYGGENNPENNISSYTIEDFRDNLELIIELKEPTRNNDEFKGWYESENFSGDPVSKISIGTNSLRDVKVYAKWIEKCSVQYETKFGTKPDSFIITKGEKLTSEQLPEVTSDDYTFEGWYIGDALIVANEYVVNSDITLTAEWYKSFDATGIRNSSDYNSGNGVLTLKSDYDKVVFKGDSSTVFSNLCIKPSSANTKLVFDNFSFSSSKTMPLIESAFDISIECKGTNKLSSSSSTVESLIKSSGTIELKGNSESSLLLQPNATTTVDCAIVRANKVIISGGNVEIGKSDGWNNSDAGRDGGNGSTGVKADVVIKNNAVVTITGGNGANGNKGDNGRDGKSQPKNDSDLNRKRAPDGENGTDGGSGGNGGLGGNAIKGKLIAETCKITLSGGDGGNGSDGGNGGNGGNGSHNNANWVHVHWCCGGGNGGNGGKAGDAGSGGNGGDAVTGTFTHNEETFASLVGGKGGEKGTPGAIGTRGYCGGAGWLCGDEGQDGHDGNPGKPGNPGKDGVQHR